MSAVKINNHATNPMNQVYNLFASEADTKTEALLWRVKASREILAESASSMKQTMLNKKITNVLALNEFASSVEQVKIQVKRVPKNSVIYVPQADRWDQDLLPKLMAASGQRGSKCFIGFTDEADFRISVNMNVPIKELVNKTH
ncbi:hypothetical protein [Photorhabdus luminescens]|uniref:Uncharacterized protein n=1 Tax=Photorhabdus luminescens subsp. mexicana TaxID=2100167 RepID=A0A4V2X4T4_PHOLU|nr:hypothetical protein [Photorhabdus luminescens]TDB45575.1 hypothetical protein C5468_20280 [Photorhabdus luminescens subsp. mexicana]